MINWYISPDQWKKANIIPIHKKVSNNLLNQYFILTACGKIYEHDLCVSQLLGITPGNFKIVMLMSFSWNTWWFFLNSLGHLIGFTLFVQTRDSTSLSLVKIFLKIPALAKINPHKILYAWPFAKINPRKIFRRRHSRKLIHAKINTSKVDITRLYNIYKFVFRKYSFGIHSYSIIFYF